MHTAATTRTKIRRGASLRSGLALACVCMIAPAVLMAQRFYRAPVQRSAPPAMNNRPPMPSAPNRGMYAQRGYGQQGYPIQAQRGFAPQQSQQRTAPEGGALQAAPTRNAIYTTPAPQRQPNNPQQRFWQQQGNAGGNVPRGQHLEQWMQSHNTMNTQQQQRALSREPGFSQLPQQTQQRMLDRLQRLNNMPLQQRERVLQRSEQMERLSPDQRRQVRGAMGQLGALPPDQRQAVARSFRELRPMSPEQRNQILNSPEYRQQFSDQQRSTLNNLLTVSPMLPQQ